MHELTEWLDYYYDENKLFLIRKTYPQEQISFSYQELNDFYKKILSFITDIKFFIKNNTEIKIEEYNQKILSLREELKKYDGF